MALGVNNSTPSSQIRTFRMWSGKIRGGHKMIKRDKDKDISVEDYLARFKVRFYWFHLAKSVARYVNHDLVQGFMRPSTTLITTALMSRIPQLLWI